MLSIKNDSDTLIIVVHEIYGINDHIRIVCDRLAEAGYDVMCPNLLTGRQETFSAKEEQKAYNYFLTEVGFVAAQRQVEDLSLRVCKQYRHCFIVGYSIGATVAWLCSSRQDLYSGAVGFYGSRIRDYKDKEPKCPVLLFFPRTEDSFDVDGLIQELAFKSNVQAIKVDALHGFANPCSKHYCQVTNEKLLAKTIEFINDQKSAVDRGL